MAEEKKQHHLFHRNKDEEKLVEEVYSDPTHGTEKYEKEKKEHKKKERLGEVGTAAGGGFALYEKREAKKDPENAHKHKIKEEIAAGVGVGAGGYAFHEHHDGKDVKKEEKRAEGKKQHHLF